MRLLHIIASANPRGGGPIEGIKSQNAATAADGVRELATLDPPGAPFLDAVSMKVYPLGRREGNPNNIISRYGFTPDFVPWLVDNVERYDAIVVNGLWNYASLGASLVLPSKKVPYFVFAHGMMDPWFRGASPLKHVAKQALWLVGEGRLVSRARAVVFTSEEERLQARGVFRGHRYREAVAPYGAVEPPPPGPEQQQAFEAAVPKLAGRPFLLFLGRIHRKKGCDLLLKAFAAVSARRPELNLVFVGPDDTDWGAQLETMAAELGVGDRVHWTGPLFGDAKWGAMRAAEAFVLPSHQENFGIAVAEALGCGVPVLISSKVNIWREVAADQAGLVAADDLAGTCELLTRWCEMMPTARSDMGRRAADLFDERFNMRKTGPALLRRLEQLL